VRRFAVLAAAAALALAAGAPARAQSISELTVALQNLQVHIATGDKAAYAAQPERLAAIGAAIAAAKPDVWKAKSETDAAVIYLLSGGQPRDIVRLLESGAVPPSEIPLMRGALAYTLGAEDEAQKRLADLDPRTLGLGLAAPVAFAQSVLETKRDPAKAMALLDLARLLAPGTLIEEAALRRETVLASDQRQVDRVAQLSRQYASRFGASVYAEAFLKTLAETLAQSGALDSSANFDKFAPFFAALAPETRRAFLLQVTRSAVLDGKFDVVAAASAQTLAAVTPGSVEEARAELYQATARILTPDYDAGLAELQSLAAAKLDHLDQELLASARVIAAFLRQPPPEVTSQTAAAPTADAQPDAAVQTIALGATALSRTAALAGANLAAGASDKGSL
jgi:chemotaxis protein MotC